MDGSNASIGCALFAFPSPYFWFRFHGYTVIPLPEKEGDPPYIPAEKIFPESGFEVKNLLINGISEAEDAVTERLILRKKAKIPQKAIIFSCKCDPKRAGQGYNLLRAKGLKKAVYICFSE